jgi:anti-sigma regulatory factor (Ser/Thr protein kinase)
MQGVRDTFERSYEGTPASIGRVRAELAAFAAEHGMHSARVDDVRLAVSEAVTNAVVHGYRGGAGAIHVTAGLDGGELWISIRDFGCGMRPQPLVSARSGMGLGLAVIGRLVSGLSVIPQPGGGTELRMRFGLMPTPLEVASRAMVT